MLNSCIGKKNVCILCSMSRNAKRKLRSMSRNAKRKLRRSTDDGAIQLGFNRFGLEQAN